VLPVVEEGLSSLSLASLLFRCCTVHEAYSRCVHEETNGWLVTDAVERRCEWPCLTLFYPSICPLRAVLAANYEVSPAQPVGGAVAFNSFGQGICVRPDN
jgi:hypothetical protein